LRAGRVSISASTTEVTEITERNPDVSSVHSVCSVVNLKLIHDVRAGFGAILARAR